MGTLGLAGIGTDQALLATLIYRLASYWLPMPTGAVAYFLHVRRYGRVRKDELSAVELEAQAGVVRAACEMDADV